MKTLNISRRSFVVLAAIAVCAVSIFSVKQVNAAGAPPETYITGMKVWDSKVTLTFKSDQPAIFQCNLDNTIWKSCSSGITWNGLAGTYGTPLQHNIQVRALNAARDVDPTPDSVMLTTPRTPVGQVYSVAMSADGCYVTATGPAGFNWLDAGAYFYDPVTGGGKGGDITYTIPASGTLTVSTGGGMIAGMVGFGSLFYETAPGDNSGQVAFAHAPVTASCPPAGL